MAEAGRRAALLAGAILVGAMVLAGCEGCRRRAVPAEVRPDPAPSGSVVAKAHERAVLRCKRSVTRTLGEYHDPYPAFSTSHAFEGTPSSAYFAQQDGSVDRVTPTGDVRRFELLRLVPAPAVAVELARVSVGWHEVVATRFRQRAPRAVDVDVGWLDGDIVRSAHLEKVLGELHHSITDTHVHADVIVVDDGVVVWFMGAPELYFADNAGKVTRHALPSGAPARRIAGRWIEDGALLARADGTTVKLPIGDRTLASVEGSLALVEGTAKAWPESFALVDAVGVVGEKRPVRASPLLRACTERRGTAFDLQTTVAAVDVHLDQEVFALDAATIELRLDGATCARTIHTKTQSDGGIDVMVRPEDLTHALYVVDVPDKPRTATALECTVDHYEPMPVTSPSGLPSAGPP